MSECITIQKHKFPKISCDLYNCYACGHYYVDVNVIELHLSRIYKKALKEKRDFAERLCEVLNHEIAHSVICEHISFMGGIQEFIACFFSFQTTHPELKKHYKNLCSKLVINNNNSSDYLIFHKLDKLDNDYVDTWRFHQQRFS